jgi:hypothetical protein
LGWVVWQAPPRLDGKVVSYERWVLGKVVLVVVRIGRRAIRIDHCALLVELEHEETQIEET